MWPEATRVGPDRIPNPNVIHGEGSSQHYPHVLNFLDCVRLRQTPHSDVATMHRSTSVGLLGVISVKLGRKLTWDAEREQFPDDPEANKLLNKEYRKPWSLL